MLRALASAQSGRRARARLPGRPTTAESKRLEETRPPSSPSLGHGHGTARTLMSRAALAEELSHVFMKGCGNRSWLKRTGT